MKTLYNKIYNAVNEGIQKALLIDPEQNDVSINYSYHKIDNNFDPLKDFIDLGLSVKWSKFNIGATCRYNDPKSWYGNYYAWGELKAKPVYDEENYDQSLNKKYNENGLHILQLEDDIVNQTYYGIEKFRMPTKEEIEELLDESKIKNEWKTDYQGVKGLKGREFTSLRNGNSIFIPAAGYFYGSKLYSADSYCSLWSSSLYSGNPNGAWNLAFYFDNVVVNDFHRCLGFSVHGVCS